MDLRNKRRGINYKFSESIYEQTNGNEGLIIISEEGKKNNLSKKADFINRYIPFESSNKKLLGKLSSLLEEEALLPENYQNSMTVLAEVEKLLTGLADALICNVEFTGVNISNLIKSSGLTIVDDAENILERVFNYIQLEQELLGIDLFILSNLSTVTTPIDIQRFIDTVIDHKYYVLLVENRDVIEYNNAVKTIVDSDLCLI